MAVLELLARVGREEWGIGGHGLGEDGQCGLTGEGGGDRR